VSARVGLERQRPRRTHAERTAETRGAIMHAVVESIAEVGFKRTTASEIARRAGVTWGAVQHHFGGKDGILVAVLEDSFRRFAERLSDISVDGRSLERRTELLSAWDAVWSSLFGDAALSRGRRLALQHYTISVLTGLSLLRRFEEPAPVVRARELSLLKETLLRELAGKAGRA